MASDSTEGMLIPTDSTEAIISTSSGDSTEVMLIPTDSTEAIISTSSGNADAQIDMPATANDSLVGGIVAPNSDVINTRPIVFSEDNRSLFVGDLDSSVTEEQLYTFFSKAAPVSSAAVYCGNSQSHGIVNFHYHSDAAKALNDLRFTSINGKSIRVMFWIEDPLFHMNSYANLFVRNLDKSVDNKSLYEMFASFGRILSCKVVTDDNGRSKGYGYVQFEDNSASLEAIEKMDGKMIKENQLYVGKFVRREERYPADGPLMFKNVYIKNLSDSVTKDDLIDIFKVCGTIDSAAIMRDASGKSRGFGFVSFLHHDSAALAVSNFNGKVYDNNILYVAKAQKKLEREAELKAKYVARTNLYIKNLDDDCDERKLEETFSNFGTITSCKVMVDSKGLSKGFGFIKFSTAEEAQKAINSMNGMMLGNKPLYVALAQRKEERRAKMEAYFARTRTRQPLLPLMRPMFYQPLAPGLCHQQLYYGQGTPRMISPVAYHHQHVAPISTMAHPFRFQRQGQLGRRMGIGRCDYQFGPQEVNNNGCIRNPPMMAHGHMGLRRHLPFHRIRMLFPVNADGCAPSIYEDPRSILDKVLYPHLD